MARTGATCLFAETIADMRRAFGRTPAHAVLIDAAVLAIEGIQGIATIAQTWPKAKRIAIGGWPPISPERFDFHIAGVDTPQAVARAAMTTSRLADPLGPSASGAVLVIDDMRTMRDLAAYMLEQEGFVVHAVAAVEEAFAYLDRVRFGAVLTDVFMAGIGGIEGIQQLRQRAPDLAIVAMSGGLGDRMEKGSALAAAIKIGAHRAISKPFQPADLVAAVRGALADAQAGVAKP